MKNALIVLAIAVAAWMSLHHPMADWQGQLAPDDPFQSSDNLPPPWGYKDFTFLPQAKYHIKAVVLSKHHYWGTSNEDMVSSYDLALGWGPMSNAAVINELNITQGGRWYYYRYSHFPPIDPSEIASHSSNHHIIAATPDVLDTIAHFKLYDAVDMQGYLVNIQSNTQDWHWHTSVSRFDTGEGACKVFWVTKAY